MLEESPQVELVGMSWDEHWADVRFLKPAWGVDELRMKLMPAGAWCAPWPEESGA